MSAKKSGCGLILGAGDKLGSPETVVRFRVIANRGVLARSSLEGVAAADCCQLDTQHTLTPFCCKSGCK